MPEGPKDLWLVEPLLAAGILSVCQAAELRLADRGSIWGGAVARGYALDRQILETISIQFKVPVANLGGLDPRTASLLPESLARKYQIVAVGADDRRIRIATADPRDLALEQTLAFATGREVLFMAASPTELGRKIEVLYRSNESPVTARWRANTIGALGLSAAEEDELARLLSHRDGIVLVTGPRGSGKTTTLYAALSQLRAGKASVVTVEDPVQSELPGVSQLQVNEAQGFTFASALRSVLRQDPDVVLVGEIREAETAMIAIQASLSGHLVLSASPATDPSEALVRLRDLGMTTSQLGSAIRGVVSQRLVRRLCPECSIPDSVLALPADARPPLDRTGENAPRRAGGCEGCSGTGYRGRLAIIGIMPAGISGAGSRFDEPPAAGAACLTSLWQSGLDRVWRGLTTLEEVARVLGEPRVAEEPAAADRPTPWSSSGTPSVLVADDDRQMRRLVRMILERDGYEVREAADGLDALDRLDANPCDLMILDLDMPRLDGMGVLEELRARPMLASLPVIVLSGRSGEADPRLRALGARDVLSKPVQPASLQARVRAVLRHVPSP